MKGTISLFGFPDTSAELDVIPRTKGWRMSRASVYWGGGLIAAPALGLIPPHAPWAVGALAIGGFMGFRKWNERFTILSLHGLCPKCGGDLSVASGTPLKPVMTLPCEGCNHDSRLMTNPSRDQPGGEAEE